MACDLEATRLVILIRPIGFDEIAVHKDPALGQRLEAPAINIRDSLLAAKIMQGPGGDNGMRWAAEPCRPGRVHEIGVGQLNPRAQRTKGFSRHLEEDFRKIEAFVMYRAVALQNVTGHVAWSD